MTDSSEILEKDEFAISFYLTLSCAYRLVSHDEKFIKKFIKLLIKKEDEEDSSTEAIISVEYYFIDFDIYDVEGHVILDVVYKEVI